jgi:formyl-CoA transferase
MPIDTRPLAGINVVSVEQAVAAPFCTARLADAGARVIKIERPEGDFARGYDDAAKGQSSYFVWLNRGKQSVVLDLSQNEAREKLEALISRTDIFINNLKPGALNKMGFAAGRLLADYPRLICCSITGYGDAGPYANRKAYDLLIQAESGLCSVTGGPSEPARVGISIVDIATGATAHASVLEALLRRSKTGCGVEIRISMFDVIADWLTVPLLNAEAGREPTRMGLSHPSIAPYGVFTTSDGHQVLIAIQSEREWRVMCLQVLRKPELAEDPSFATNVLRIANRAATDTAVGSILSLRTGNELMADLARYGIAYAELNDMASLARHPQLRRVAIETEVGTISIPAPAPIVNGETQVGTTAPALGADTNSVIAELGP